MLEEVADAIQPVGADLPDVVDMAAVVSRLIGLTIVRHQRGDRD